MHSQNTQPEKWLKSGSLFISLPLLSLISTAAWASSSRAISSLLPLRAAWCSGDNLHKKTRVYAGNVNFQMNNLKPRKLSERVTNIEQLLPSALRVSDVGGGANDLLPLISCLFYPSAKCVCVCIPNGSLVNVRARPKSHIDQSTLTEIILSIQSAQIKKTLLYDGVKSTIIIYPKIHDLMPITLHNDNNKVFTF